MALYGYITFPTIYLALRAEALIKETGHSYKMVPVPRSISSSCGTALRCQVSDLEAVTTCLAHHRVEIEGTYEIEEKSFSLPRLFSGKEGHTDGR